MGSVSKEFIINLIAMVNVMQDRKIFAEFRPSIFTLFILLPICLKVDASPLVLESSPLYISNAVKPNLLLSIDDSGSMDFEVLFPSNDGSLWWNTTNQQFVNNGAVNFNNAGGANASFKKFSYLFPNGNGIGERTYGDSDHAHYAIPPLPQLAFVRSSVFNGMYYNPNVTYEPWFDYDTVNFNAINQTSAPSDPGAGSSTFNLTQNIQSNTTNHVFKMYPGMILPLGTTYNLSGSWSTATSDTAITTESNVGITYFPATYYQLVNSGNYSINGITGNCSTPNASHYTIFSANPSSLSGAGIDAVGPDGQCLSKIEIKSTLNSYAQNGERKDCLSNTQCTYNEEIQNFSNWFSYYRKRHLALKAGMGHSFNGQRALRTGLFTINNRSAVTMWDMNNTTDNNSFYSSVYSLGHNGGTPNRNALDFAGQQYLRTDNGAPINQVCQKNFTLHFTDGFTSLEGTLPTVSLKDNSEGQPYADTYDNTFADIAMHYYKTNLRPDLTTGQVATPSACPSVRMDCNPNLHMSTYMIGLGAKGTLFGNGTYEKVSDAYDIPPTWPNTNTARDPRQIDDLYHAALNGRGEIFNAKSADDLKNQLQNALSSIQSKVGSSASVTFNTASLQSDSSVYFSLFNSADWSGDVYSYPIDADGNISATHSWQASNQLPAPNTRKIITYNGSDGISFTWGNLTASQKADLNLAPDNNGQNALAYLRGDRSLETSGQYRMRGSVLGDIINAGPVYVGTPSLNWPSTGSLFPTSSGNKYSDFRRSQLSSPRTEVVYAGANDGMLHGFRADTGEEVLGYIPGSVYSTNASEGLHYLSSTEYQHRYYVDLPLSVSDVFIDPTGGSSPSWRTILLGGLRSGGKGLFALDITDPSQFSEANAAAITLWEFTHPNLGYTFSKPTIAMMENGRWAAVFGNGYNNTGSGQASLFIVFIDGGLDGVWTDGSSGTPIDYIELSTQSGTTATPNGLATPALVDLDGNGAVDRVYGGDLLGQMWTFDLSDNSTIANATTSIPAWRSAYQTTTIPITPIPLFAAKDSSGNAQPITNKPNIARHPAPLAPTGNEPDVLVFFGTGKYLETIDITDTSSQSFYGVWDSGTGNLVRSDLVSQAFLSGTITDNDTNSRTDLRVITDHIIDYTTHKGWHIDLPASGERVIVNSIVRGSLIFFNTWIPSSTPCGTGGSGYLMSVEMLNGGAPDQAAFNVTGTSGIDNTDSVTVDDGTTTTNTNPVGEKFDDDKGMPTASAILDNKQYTAGTGGDNQHDPASDLIHIREIQELPTLNTGRISWEQLVGD
ncbi:MAG: PilC/PilY family type IV pilus protein [Methylococcaceae bacterium]